MIAGYYWEHNRIIYAICWGCREGIRNPQHRTVRTKHVGILECYLCDVCFISKDRTVRARRRLYCKPKTFPHQNRMREPYYGWNG